jgi:hypothetical protein
MRWAQRHERTLVAEQPVQASDVIAALPVGLHPDLVPREMLQRLCSLAELRLELFALLRLRLRLQVA